MSHLDAHATPAAAGEESTAPSAEDAGQAGGGRVDRSGPRFQRLGGTEAPLLFRLLFDEPHFRAGAHFRAAGAAAAAGAASPASAAGVAPARCAVRVSSE